MDDQIFVGSLRVGQSMEEGGKAKKTAEETVLWHLLKLGTTDPVEKDSPWMSSCRSMGYAACVGDSLRRMLAKERDNVSYSTYQG